MFRRHRTDRDRDNARVADAFHARLAGTTVTNRTDPPHIDPIDLRARLGASTAAGLHDRLARPRIRRGLTA